ncbi:16S rRNA (uracil(1498)-N(3))-methyltransferase [Legionella waltersii]|uniref:Ribosomal RNA small subunit methyltransferase E n=1 Tax=Legionella waltersii TaxID=66969 RepID=A0A0W1A5D6_9GAMM|nr:16S rRNA (uracil(1498)-N(3))-methyltransferase [Legionella waltersii]KTD76432.1 16S ribosomal RNA methyltransferase RsmE [Legionella waltersii]SNV14416.1 Ribosomal RNA small subunit methyltransferase E (16S rRNA m3U1498 methyltransferase) [Legionella waltersii]
MREVRIYQAGDYQSGQVIELSSEAGQHVAVVLRMQPGSKLTLFSGNNQEFEAVIQQVKKKQVFVTIGEAKEANRESPLLIHLAQAISKGDRMEMVMQKAVELGVACITPIITERCQVKLDHDRMMKKMQQWQNIIISACEQCGRNRVPEVQFPMSLERFLKESSAKLKLVLHPNERKTWRDYTFSHQDIALLIGPEGGLSEEEVKQASGHGFLPLSLGPRILRTETAAITALTVLQAVAGDL